MNFKARSIALASALKIELANGNRREATCCPKTSTDATLAPSFEPSVYKYAVSNFGKNSDRKRPTVAPLSLLVVYKVFPHQNY
jgi:hypothetical protein